MILPILTVQDVDASVDYYVSKLGFTKDMVMAGPDGKNTFGFVRLGKAIIGLDAMTPGAAKGAPGADFMVYVPDETDLDQHYAEVKSRGTVIETPIETKYWGDRVYTVLDPDGYRITITKTVKQMSPEEVAALSGNKLS